MSSRVETEPLTAQTAVDDVLEEIVKAMEPDDAAERERVEKALKNATMPDFPTPERPPRLYAIQSERVAVVKRDEIGRCLKLITKAMLKQAPGWLSEQGFVLHERLVKCLTAYFSKGAKDALEQARQLSDEIVTHHESLRSCKCSKCSNDFTMSNDLMNAFRALRDVLSKDELGDA